MSYLMVLDKSDDLQMLKYDVQGVPANYKLIMSIKVEFWKWFTFQAPLEIRDAIE